MVGFFVSLSGIIFNTADGSGEEKTLKVAEFLLTDNSGQVFLQVFDEDCESIKIGSTYRFKNIKTLVHRGFLHILSRPHNYSIEESLPDRTLPNLQSIHASNIVYEFIY